MNHKEKSILRSQKAGREVIYLSQINAQCCELNRFNREMTKLSSAESMA